MNEQLTAAQPPIFFATHSASIAAAAREYPDADGLLIDVHAQRMLVAVHISAGVIDWWVIESPVGFDEIDERKAQIEKTGAKYVCLTMHVDRVVELAPRAKH